tara:strand:+ start:1145 stop:1876 length:732 start_codon:yes stop_codon:yes gene_type:complete
MKTLVSVIIPFNNNIEELNHAINSVFMQTYKNFEIILVDDYSSKSLDAIQLYLSNDRIKYFRNNSNKGPGYSRNVGIENSSGEYIAFLDSDDIWLNNKIELQLNYMKKNNLLFSHTSYFRNNKVNGKSKKIRSGLITYIYPSPLFFCRIATPSVMIKRDLIKNHKFDNNLRFLEDTYLWHNLSKTTKLYGINYFLVEVNVTKNSSFMKKKEIIKSYKIILKKLKNEFKILYFTLRVYLFFRYL